MIRLFVLGTGWGIPFVTAAPFPLKLMTWLRMVDLPFEVIVENNAGRGPKKKSPWIVDGETRLGDTELIIDHLATRYGTRDLDEGRSDAELATCRAFRLALEEHFHQAFEHELFLGRGGRARLTELADTLPPGLRTILPIFLRRSLRTQLYTRGLGRHTSDDIVAMGKADLDAVSAFLGDKNFFLGDSASRVDATIFGFLGVTVYAHGDNPLFCHAASKQNLVAYCARMRAAYFPETLP